MPECVDSASASVYFRMVGTQPYEKFISEHCPIDVSISGGSENYVNNPGGQVLGQMYNVSISYEVDSLAYVFPNRIFDPNTGESTGNAYGGYIQRIPIGITTETLTLPGPVSDFGYFKVDRPGYDPDAYYLAITYPQLNWVYDPQTDSSTPVWSEPFQRVFLIGRSQLRQIVYTGFYDEWYPGGEYEYGSSFAVINSIIPVDGGGQGHTLVITDQRGEVFRKTFPSPVEYEIACDCEQDCIAVYSDDYTDFICICAKTEKDEDWEKLKEIIKAELKAELTPLIKQQVIAEVKPLIKQQMIDEIKSALLLDTDFIDSLKAAIQSDTGADNLLVNGSTLKVSKHGDTPYQVTVQGSLTDITDYEITEALNSQYGGNFTLGEFQIFPDKVIIPVSKIS